MKIRKVGVGGSFTEEEAEGSGDRDLPLGHTAHQTEPGPEPKSRVFFGNADFPACYLSYWKKLISPRFLHEFCSIPII